MRQEVHYAIQALENYDRCEEVTQDIANDLSKALRGLFMVLAMSSRWVNKEWQEYLLDLGVE